jgi:hypothetical protein
LTLHPKNWFKTYLIHDISDLYKDKRIEKELPEILAYLRLWDFKATLLRGLHILLGVSATFFSLLAASQIMHGTTYSTLAAIFAFIAAVSISLMTAFNLGEKSNNIRTAWRRLNVTVLKFNQNLCEKSDVIDSYEEGESLIGDVVFRTE